MIMIPNETGVAQMAHLAEEIADGIVAGQAMGLQVLAAEMQALSRLIPGMVYAEGHAPTQAEIEADFDNMPV